MTDTATESPPLPRRGDWNPDVIVPHTPDGLHPRTAAWTLRQQWTPHTIQIDPLYTYGYGELLLSRWTGVQDLVVVEQDVVPPDMALRQFCRCPMPWCTHPYEIDGVLHERVLGCTRFTAALQKAFPHLMWQAARNLGGRRESTPWWSLNEQIIRYLDICRIPVHPHTPPAEHLHAYEAPSG